MSSLKRLISPQGPRGDAATRRRRRVPRPSKEQRAKRKEQRKQRWKRKSQRYKDALNNDKELRKQNGEFDWTKCVSEVRLFS